jgi:ADP-ribose pyrophosphatase YjhB (NUDIX family)
VNLADALMRTALTAAHRLLKAGWFIRRPRTFGAHALALTPERKLILVKLRYAAGWRLPGGGRAADERPADAVLRELREEIGMISHGAVRLGCELEQDTDFKHDLASLLVVEEVRYTPRRWSWEVEATMEAPFDALPPDMAPIALEWINAVRDRL